MLYNAILYYYGVLYYVILLQCHIKVYYFVLASLRESPVDSSIGRGNWRIGKLAFGGPTFR